MDIQKCIKEKIKDFDIQTHVEKKYPASMHDVLFTHQRKAYEDCYTELYVPLQQELEKWKELAKNDVLVLTRARNQIDALRKTVNLSCEVITDSVKLTPSELSENIKIYQTLSNQQKGE